MRVTRLSRRVAAAAVASLTVLAPGAAAPAGAGRPGNPWLDRPFVHIAHQGGESEAPSNTMYAFRRAVRIGADVLELDVHSTADGVLVASHDASVDRTTDGTGLIRDKTYRELRRLDAAYNFVPGRNAVPGLPPEAYPLRGVRTHDRPPPRGYQAGDFAVPALHDVLRAFRHVPLSIEIKGTADADTESFLRNARLLADLLTKAHRTRDVIVTSFNDAAVAEFHRLAPKVALAPGMRGLTDYFFTGARPIEGTVALQVPVTYQGVPVATPEFVARAHADGYAVHVWFSGTAPEDGPTYNTLIDACADGLMSSWPTLMERVLDERGLSARRGRPASPRCPGTRS
ncbi:glycerophosphodiester phosphodiesterase family protein [Phytohabitans suffuscus]|uniref:Glycerophosphoryl diester phosphodiesterase n=1 Tax=Phytohabitans suffuscus TaxID=624315 RepID=A0A6F8YYD9_9ACTN|nr:glycerophosphodiester phosphodiesterase family protein [Phytohabitans suffuscus]BCB90958.1 glycerophosphoryl diester phosphodiesterase [Phytohabitans suffuscus]